MSSGALRWWEAYATGVACDSSNKFSSLSTRFSRRPTQKNDFNVFGTIRSAVLCRIVPHSAVAVAPKYSSVPNSKQCSRSTNIVGIISFVVLRSRPLNLPCRRDCIALTHLRHTSGSFPTVHVKLMIFTSKSIPIFLKHHTRILYGYYR